jgi:uncharacterized protein
VKITPQELRIAVIADTHNSLPESVAADIATAHEIWHLGDVCQSHILDRIQRLGPPVTVVQGNNDFFQPLPLEVLLTRNGLRFRLIHIPPPLTKLGTAHILLHGHTHVPRDEVIDGIRILNPGTVGKPNHGAPPSYAWLTLMPEGTLDWKIVPVSEPQ